MSEVPVTMKVDVVSGVEGPSLYFDDYRVDGPKPWGGGRISHTFVVLVQDIPAKAAIEEQARAQGAAEERARLRFSLDDVRTVKADAVAQSSPSGEVLWWRWADVVGVFEDPAP